MLALVAALLTLPANAAICRNGCSGHGSCGLLGTCICEGSWAGRDCSFQLSLDTEVPETNLEMPALSADPLDSAVLALGAKGGQSQVDITSTAVRSFAHSRRAAESAWATADKSAAKRVVLRSDGCPASSEAQAVCSSKDRERT